MLAAGAWPASPDCSTPAPTAASWRQLARKPAARPIGQWRRLPMGATCTIRLLAAVALKTAHLASELGLMDKYIHDGVWIAARRGAGRQPAACGRVGCGRGFLPRAGARCCTALFWCSSHLINGSRQPHIYSRDAVNSRRVSSEARVRISHQALKTGQCGLPATDFTTTSLLQCLQGLWVCTHGEATGEIVAAAVLCAAWVLSPCGFS